MCSVPVEMNRVMVVVIRVESVVVIHGESVVVIHGESVVGQTQDLYSLPLPSH